MLTSNVPGCLAGVSDRRKGLARNVVNGGPDQRLARVGAAAGSSPTLGISTVRKSMTGADIAVILEGAKDFKEFIPNVGTNRSSSITTTST